MKRKPEGAFLKDLTAEEIVLLENRLSRMPNAERAQRGALAWLGDKLYDLAAQGEVATCYSDDTEHTLHPDGFPWVDASGLIPLQRTGDIEAPVERAV